MDELWCEALQGFPQYPDWVLVKEKHGVYRLGHANGKKILCRVSHAGLQVRVGGGWAGAAAFLARHGPAAMGPARPPGEGGPSSAAALTTLAAPINTGNSVGNSGGDFLLATTTDAAPSSSCSVDRLLLPTKCWAKKIGINTTPDLRELRRQEPLPPPPAPAAVSSALAPPPPPRSDGGSSGGGSSLASAKRGFGSGGCSASAPNIAAAVRAQPLAAAVLAGGVGRHLPTPRTAASSAR